MRQQLKRQLRQDIHRQRRKLNRALRADWSRIAVVETMRDALIKEFNRVAESEVA